MSQSAWLEKTGGRKLQITLGFKVLVICSSKPVPLTLLRFPKPFWQVGKMAFENDI